MLVYACDVIADLLLHFHQSQSHFNNHNNNNKLSCRLQLPPRTRTRGVCASERMRTRSRAFLSSVRVELCSYNFIEVDIEIVCFVFFFLMVFFFVASLVWLSFHSSLFSYLFVILLNCVHINDVCTNWCERLLAVCHFFMFAFCGRRRMGAHRSGEARSCRRQLRNGKHLDRKFSRKHVLCTWALSLGVNKSFRRWQWNGAHEEWDGVDVELLMCHLERRLSMDVRRWQKVGARTHSNDTMAGAISKTWQFIIIIVLILSLHLLRLHRESSTDIESHFRHRLSILREHKTQNLYASIGRFSFIPFRFVQILSTNSWEARWLAGWPDELVLPSVLPSLVFVSQKKRCVRSTLNVLSTCLW